MTSPLKVRQKPEPHCQNIVFFHPDLGIGGAERLIVDAAVGLQDLGHKVTIFTSHCDPRHCFEEARDGTLDVRVRGNTIFPPTILNRFHILLAILRQIHLVLYISLFSNELYALKPDVFIVDQLSACVPLLRWLYPKRQRTLFYCHFPDQLLAERDKQGLLGVVKKLYRYPFDCFEGWSMSAADRIVVNSRFTKGVSARIFPSLQRYFGVIYPCVPNSSVERKSKDEKPLWNNEFKILLSINRFERKKGISLAIRAYTGLSDRERKGTRLVIAGGYDQRVAENVQYHQELLTLAEEAGLRAATSNTVLTALDVPRNIEVLFLLSIPEAFKATLLQNASLLIYTPSNEHFGIVPVEAMSYGVPVLASNTGGPLETIEDGKTGWLRDTNAVEEWTGVMRTVLLQMSTSERETMAQKSRQKVQDHFTQKTMAKVFDEELRQMMQAGRPAFLERETVILVIGLLGAFSAALLALVMRTLFQPDVRSTEFARIDRRLRTGGRQFRMPVVEP